MWGTIFYNAKVYDLVGDGTTNDYTKFYNLINTTINGAEATIIFPKGTYKISSNITIPSNISLYFVKGAMLSPDSGVTVTINGSIEAGYYQIFKFVDATSQIATKNIGVWNDVADSTLVHYNVKVDWFGAKPDAAPPVNYTGTQLPTGTDSSDGFRRAFKYALQASVKTSSTFLKRPKVTVEAAPNGCYYVKGNNLMGCQDTSVVGMLVDFEGNSCQILHEVLVSSDTLIDNAYKMYSPHFKNFDVDVYTQLSGTRVGKFLDLKGGSNTIKFVTPKFSNVRVGTGFEYKGYDIIFNIDGTTMGDNGLVENGYFGGFNKFFNCVNPEAVNWKFQNNYIHPTTINSVIYNFPGSFSGSFTSQGNEILTAFNGERILKTVGTVDPGGIFTIEDRCELRITVDTILFDLDYGTVNVKGINFFAGAGAGSRPGTFRNARIGNLACISFEDCYLVTGEFDVGPMDQTVSSGQPNNMLVLVNSSLTGSGYDGYPKLFYKLLDNSTLTTKQTLSAGYRIRKVVVENPNGTSTSFIPLNMESDYGTLQKFQIVNSTSTKSIVQGTSVRIPFYCVIKSIKLYIEAQNLTIVNQLNVNFKLINGFVTDASFVYTLPGTVQYGVELLNNQMVFVDDAVIIMDFEFKKDSVAVTDANSPQSYIEIEYRGISSLVDFAAFSSGSGRISIV